MAEALEVLHAEEAEKGLPVAIVDQQHYDVHPFGVVSPGGGSERLRPRWRRRPLLGAAGAKGAHPAPLLAVHPRARRGVAGLRKPAVAPEELALGLAHERFEAS